MNIEQTYEAFAEGARYTTEEGWVDPRDIEDAELCLKYHHVVNAYTEYQKHVREFQNLLEEKAEKEGVHDG